MRALPLASALAASVAVFTVAPSGRAACPDSGPVTTSTCQPTLGFFMPSVNGVAYLPRTGGMGPWVGAGFELVLATWSSNSDGFGPSQGKLRLDVAGLGSTDGAPAMVMYRGGAAVSFEGNAGRRFMIPYFGGAFGGMHESQLGGHAYGEPELGLYVVYLRNLIVDVEGAFVFPFSDFSTLAGPKTQLTVSFQFW